MRDVTRILCGVFLLLSFAGCASTNLTVTASATPDINRSQRGHPLPVLVRLYQLSDIEAFQSAGFHELWKKDQALLGSDLLLQKEFVITPGEAKPIAWHLLPQTRYLAAVAIFHQYQGKRWRDATILRYPIPFLTQHRRLVVDRGAIHFFP